jgi:hypothetical protein
VEWSTAGRSSALGLLGLGAVLGALIGPSALWYGLAAIVLAAVVLPFERRRAASGTAPMASPPADPRERRAGSTVPSLAGLGGRAEKILRLAEENALAHLAEAQREADAIVSAARAQARDILAGAEATARKSAAKHTDPTAPTEPPPQ